MTEELLEAVRQVRREADRLRLACIVAARTGALLHVAYDRDLMTDLPTAEAVLLGRLDRVQ